MSSDSRKHDPDINIIIMKNAVKYGRTTRLLFTRNR